MPKAHQPRSGSMGYWPRKKAKRIYARVRSWPKSTEAKPLGFAGYKIGMGHVIATDSKPTSMTKGNDISVPVTLIECPPIKVMSARFYKKTNYGLRAFSDIRAKDTNKELLRKVPAVKEVKKKPEDIKDYDEVRLVVYTQPHLTGTGKKKPEIFEIGLGGNKEDQCRFACSMLGKDIKVSDVVSEGQQIDIHAITKSKGFQGPVKRFGISIKSHKSEKTKRGPGNLGGWKAQQHIMPRVAHAGHMGFHTRTEYNKWVLRISDKPGGINPKGGFKSYGIIKNPYIIVKGSIAGPAKRIVRVTQPARPNKKIPAQPHQIRQVMVG